MTTVLYDCTRLVAQRNAPTPTGIDRVDIHYLNSMLDEHGANVVGVFQHGNHLIAMTYEQLSVIRKHLFDRWIGDGLMASQKEDENLNLINNDLVKLAKDLESLPQKPLIHPNVTSILSEKENQTTVYINASHRGLDKEALMSSLKIQLQCKVIIFIHDIIPIDFPEYVSPGDDTVHKRRMANTSAIADTIIVNSTYTKERVENFYNLEEYRCPPVEIFYIGADKKFSKSDTKNTLLEGKKYFVTVGTIEPRKNHALLLNIWRKWINESEDVPYLVIIGKRGWHISTVTNMIDLSSTLSSRVIEMSGLSDQDMVSIIQGSDALLFPSFVEGWGMPLAEALSMGVGAICSDLSVFKECGQDLAIAIDPIDGAKWYSTLRMVHEDVSFRDALRENAKKYVSPDWGIHLSKLNELVKRLSSSEAASEDLKPHPFGVQFVKSHEDRLSAWLKYTNEKEEALCDAFPETYKPKGSAFEERFKSSGNPRCLRLAAEAYVEEGRPDDAIRVLKIASKLQPKIKNIKNRILVLKKPVMSKLLGDNRFEPYYYGKTGIE